MSLNSSFLAIPSDASVSLLEFNREEFEIELTPHPIIQKACIERSLKIWILNNIDKAQVYISFRNSWNLLGRLDVTEDDELFYTFIFSFQVVEDKKKVWDKRVEF